MKKFKLNENITEEALVNGIVEMYVYYFNKCRDFGELSEAPDYYAAVGASNAVGAIALQVLGGKQMFELWRALTDVPEDDVPEV